MMVRFLIGIAVLAGLLVAGDYSETIRAWHKHREVGLRAPDSWLTLVGLFWLKQGDNTIGSADHNDFVLPKNTAPEHAGKLHLEGKTVTYIKADGKKETLSYSESETDDKPTIAHAGRVSFFVIKRGDKLAIRAKDSESPVLKNFTGLDYFPINPALHFHAKLIPDAKKIPIIDITGRLAQEESPGVVEFSYQGNQYHLRPIYEGKTLYFLFKDKTNRVDTYQAGRMLNTPLPVDGVVDLDFNRSYNPPCTFTPYATCPLPPRSNTLPFAVNAGEKRYHKGRPDSETE